MAATTLFNLNTISTTNHLLSQQSEHYVWLSTIKLILTQADIDYTTYVDTKPNSTDLADNKYKQSTAKAMMYMQMQLSPALRTQVPPNTASAYDLHEWIKQQLSIGTATHKAALSTQWHNMKMAESEHLNHYIDRLVTHAGQMNEYKCGGCSDTDQIMKMLMTVNTTYLPIATQLSFMVNTAAAGTTYTMSQVCIQLRQAAESRIQPVQPPTVAMYASSHKPYTGGDNRHSDGKGKGRRNNFGDAQCTNCKNYGHTSTICHPHPRSQMSKYKHVEESAKVATEHTLPPAVTTPEGTIDWQYLQFYAPPPREYANMAVHSTLHISKDKLVFDTGASSHMVYRRELFCTYGPAPVSHIHLGNDSTIPVLGMGSIVIATTVGDKTYTRQLDGVLHVPQLSHNLISGIKLMGSDINFASENGKLVFKVDDQVIAVAHMHANVIIMDGHILQPTTGEQKVETALLTTVTEDELKDWHRKLGHANMQTVIKTINSLRTGAARILPATLPVCDVCALAKAKRDPFPTSTHESTQPLQLVHMDTAGPFDTAIGGYRYMMIIVDDYSKHITVQLVTQKSEAYEQFVLYKALMENQLGHRIKSIRTDRGREYINQSFIELCEREGIVHQSTVGYTPQQNGTAERHIGVLMNKVRAMLIDNHVPKQFWGYAAKAAAYVHNRVVSSKRTITPHELLYGDKPDIEVLHVFGCIAYPWIPHELRGKLDPRSIKCRFIGYAEHQKGWLLFDENNGCVLISRDVKFDDHTAYPHDTRHQSATEVIITVPIIPIASRNDIVAPPPQPVQQQAVQVPLNQGDININHSAPPAQQQPAPPQVPAQVPAQEAPRRQLPSRALRGIPTADIAHIKNYVYPLHSETSIEIAHKYLQDNPTSHYTIDRLVDIINHSRPTEVALLTTHVNTKEPQSYAEAMQSPDRDMWEAAIAKELAAHAKCGTWSTVDKQPGINVISCKWVFTIKYKRDGTIDKYKARLVARGFSQQYMVDYHETYSPVVKLTTLRIVLALVAIYDLELEQMDVATAFLNAKVSDEELYMAVPLGVQVSGSKVCKLNRYIYGLKQSPRAWYKTIDAFLSKLGFQRVESDYGLYVQWSSKLRCIITLYVDDILIASDSAEYIKHIKKQLSTEYDMVDLGSAKYILGLGIDRDRTNHKLYLSQHAYLANILATHSMENCNGRATPLSTKHGLREAMTPPTTEQQQMSYRSMIGELQYAVTCTRPDLAYTVSLLSSFSMTPQKEHYDAIHGVYRYIRETLNYRLCLGGKQVSVVGYSDADYANTDLSGRKSITGYVYYVGEGPVAWYSKKQSTISLSTAEAEYVSMSTAVREALFIKQLLQLIGITVQPSIVQHCDNQAAIQLAANPVHHSRTKHIDVKHHHIRDHVENQTLTVTYCATDDMIADGLTKPLDRYKHTKFLQMLMTQT